MPYCKNSCSRERCRLPIIRVFLAHLSTIKTSPRSFFLPLPKIPRISGGGVWVNTPFLNARVRTMLDRTSRSSGVLQLHLLGTRKWFSVKWLFLGRVRTYWTLHLFGHCTLQWGIKPPTKESCPSTFSADTLCIPIRHPQKFLPHFGIASLATVIPIMHNSSEIPSVATGQGQKGQTVLAADPCPGG